MEEFFPTCHKILMNPQASQWQGGHLIVGLLSQFASSHRVVNIVFSYSYGLLAYFRSDLTFDQFACQVLGKRNAVVIAE
jgi:hypothetical protein